MKCPLCAFEFVEFENYTCKGCPMHHNCTLVCCPNCHYHFLTESKIVGWTKKLFSKKESKKVSD